MFLNNYLHTDGTVCQSRCYLTKRAAERSKVKAVRFLAQCGVTVISETVTRKSVLENRVLRPMRHVSRL